MHYFRIDIYALNSDGTVGAFVQSEYADTPEQAVAKHQKWESIMHTETDEDGNVTESYKAYKALIKTAKYIDVNVAQFLAMFKS